jgi:RHS repeat-associated protein
MPLSRRRGLALVAAAVCLWGLIPGSAAATQLPSTISSDMTLTQAGSPYTSTGSVTINSGVTVTVEPGVKVQLSGLSSTLNVDGTLRTQGTTAQPDVFTSSSDSGSGQWKGIALNSGSGASVLDHAEVRYGGYNSTAAVAINSASPTITTSTIRNNRSYGIRVTNGGAPEIANNTIIDNVGNGISYSASSGQSGQIKIHDNDVERNSDEGIFVSDRYSNVTGTTLRGNTLKGNRGFTGIHFGGGDLPADIDENTLSGNDYDTITTQGSLTSSASWDDRGYPFVLSGGDLTVAQGATLTLSPGVVFKSSTGKTITINGTLDAQGTAENPITFTSQNDASSISWGGISLNSGSGASVLDHVEVRYGGWSTSTPAISISGSSPSISNSTIRNNKNYAIKVATGNPSITHSTIKANWYGIYVSSGSPTIRWNKFQGDSIYGLLYGGTGVLSAPNNDWNCASGPSPAGCGDKVSSNVAWFPPWGTPAPHGHCQGHDTQCRPGADPVSLATGDLTYAHTDLQLTGKGLPLEFSRAYNSGDNSDAGLGPGWSHSGLISATELESGDVVVRRPDGRQDTFTKTQGSYTAPSGITDTLTKNGDGTFKLTTLDRTVYDFNSSGRIARHTDDHGLQTTYNYDSNGRLASIADASGQSLTFTYDSSKHITKVADSAGRQVTFAYGSAGDLATVTDALGGVTTYAYDSSHHLTSITDPAGHTYLTNTYDSQGRVTAQRDGLNNLWNLSYSSGQTQVTEPEGGTQTFSFDANDRLVSETDELGRTTSYGYDGAGNVNDITRPGGAEWRLNYDAARNLVSATDPEDGQSTFTYDAQNRLTSYTDPRAKTWTYAWNPSNDLTQITDPKNQTTTLTYNSAGQPLSITDPKSHTASFAYDTRGNLTSRTDALGHAMTYGYDPYNNVTSLTRPGVPAETYERNKLGDLLSVTTPEGNSTSYAYDPNGAPTRIIDPALNVWQIDRNAMERPTTITDPLGNQIQIAYDGNLNPTRVTDRRGNATAYGYDQANRLTEIELPGGGTYSFGYDGRGNRTQITDPLNDTTAYTYDLLDRLTQVDEPLGTTTRYGYDPNGNPTSVTDPRGNRTDLTYDELGQLTRIDQPLAKQTSFTYDPAGNLATRTTAATTLDFNYDAADRLTQVANGQNVLRSYGYDAADRLTQATDAQNKTIAIGWNGEDRVTSIDDGRGQSVARAYDSRGNLTSQTDGRGTLTYTYDALDRLTGLTDPQGVAQSFAYNPEGALTEADLGNGVVTTNAYDPDGRMTQTESRSGQNTLQSFAYGYDAEGRLTSQTDEQGQQTTYDYDALGRLTQFDPPGAPVTSYAYDAAGNRTQAGGTTYDYNALNQLTHSSEGTDYTYDGAGRLTQRANGSETTSYGWDPLDEMIQVQDGQGTTGFSYDVLGRRSERTDSAGTETAHYGDLSEVPILDTSEGGSVLRSYVQGPGPRGEGQLLEERADGATTYPLANGRGDITAVLDDAGQVSARASYDPWGAQLSGPSRRMGYLGAYERRTDPSTGLVQMGIRAYDPSQGRFLTEDPVVVAVGVGQSVDRYAYVFDDPLNRYDLSGRFLGPVGQAINNAWDSTAPVRGTVTQLVTDPGGSATQAVHYWVNSDNPAANVLGPIATLEDMTLNRNRIDDYVKEASEWWSSLLACPQPVVLGAVEGLASSQNPASEFGCAPDEAAPHGELPYDAPILPPDLPWPQHPIPGGKPFPEPVPVPP